MPGAVTKPEQGYIELETGERFQEIKQADIKENVSLLNASKMFSLELEGGPYKTAFTDNGRHLIFLGSNGHVGAFDRLTYRLSFERYFEEECFDITWLHNETIFSAAHAEHLYLYDQDGVETHRVHGISNPRQLSFLPYHFLLASTTAQNRLFYLDVTDGRQISNHNLGMPSLCLGQNRSNGVLATGSRNGAVSFWGPNSPEPLAKMLCHNGPVASLAFGPSGKHLVTGGVDGQLKIWDLRTYKPVDTYRLSQPATTLSVSQRGVVAAGLGTRVHTWKDVFQATPESPYLVHSYSRDLISSLAFCPYDDVLGVGTGKRVDSLLIPGSGESGFDALESNPFEGPKQRQELEIKRIIEKLPPEMISLSSALSSTPALRPKISLERATAHEEATNLVSVREKQQGRNKTKTTKVGRKQRREKILKEAEKIEKRRNKEAPQPLKAKRSQDGLDRFRQ